MGDASDERHDWRTVVEFRHIHDELGSMRGTYLWMGLATTALGLATLFQKEHSLATIGMGVLFLVAALCFLLARWRVYREPRFWAVLCATVYTTFGAAGVARAFLDNDTSASGFRYQYVSSAVYFLALWSVIPPRKTLEFLSQHADEWDEFCSKK